MSLMPGSYGCLFFLLPTTHHLHITMGYSAGPIHRFIRLYIVSCSKIYILDNDEKYKQWDRSASGEYPNA